MGLSMTREERETYLAGLHVGVIAIAEGEGPPLAVPIWYAYEPGGELRFVTGRNSRKGKLLAVGRRLTFCAQTEEPPLYKYVSVDGTVVAIEAADTERDTRPIARRYFGEQLGDLYVARSAAEAQDESILVRVRIDRWRTVDYAKEYASAV